MESTLSSAKAADRSPLCDEISIRGTRQDAWARQTAGTPSVALCREQADRRSVAELAVPARRSYELAAYDGIQRSL